MDHPESSTEAVNRVIVTDIRMGFGSMVVFMVKWVIASIPAAIILAVVAGVFWAIVGSFLGGVG
jgi:ABC-type multidrug transport system permease subunit